MNDAGPGHNHNHNHNHNHGYGGVGGVGEEAARLLEAVQDWARRTAGSGDADPGADPGADAEPDAEHDADSDGACGAGGPERAGSAENTTRSGTGGDPRWSGRISSDALECQLCPLCRLIAIVRGTRPEVIEHLADAVSSLAAAIRELLAAAQHERTGPSAVERIDIG